jgi:hypothetical protein
VGAKLKSACQDAVGSYKEGGTGPKPPVKSVPASHSRLAARDPMALSDVPGRARAQRTVARGVAAVAVAVGCGGRAQYSAIAFGLNLTDLPIRTCGMRPSRACRSNHWGSTDSASAASAAVTNLGASARVGQVLLGLPLCRNALRAAV